MVINHKDYNGKNLLFKNVEDKESYDKTAKYKKFNVEYDVNGNRMKPMFELCPVTINNGLRMETEPGKLSKLQAHVRFPMNKNNIVMDLEQQGYDDATTRANEIYEDVKSCVNIPEMDETRGWVNKKELELTVDVGVCTGLTKSSTKVYVSDSSSNVKTILDENTHVEVLGKSDDNTMLQIKTGGTEGFFYKVKKDIAKMVFDNKVRCGMGSKSYEDILAIVRDPIYYNRDKNGEINMDKDPSSFMKVTYFPPNASKGTEESVAKFSLPMINEDLDLPTLQSKRITCIPCLQLLYVYIGSGKILPQFYIKSAVVTSIEDFKKINRNVQQSTMSSLTTDVKMMEKLKEQVAKMKLSPVKTPVDVDASNTNMEPTTTSPMGIEKFLETGPTLHDADLDNDIDDLSDNE